MPRKTNRPRNQNLEDLHSALSAEGAADEDGDELDGQFLGPKGLDRDDFDGDLDNEYAEPEPGDFWLDPEDDEI